MGRAACPQEYDVAPLASYLKTRPEMDLHLDPLRDELMRVRVLGGEGLDGSIPIGRLRSLGATHFDDFGQLLAFKADCEAIWGRSVTQLELSRLQHGDVFAIHKAVALARLGRSPEDVTEGFCTASGSVGGVRLEPREIFWQRFKPVGIANHRVVVVSPRFGETGRSYYDLIQTINEAGFEAFVMDHQWAGQSDGKPGQLDRGYGAGRDVAAMVAYAHSLLEREKDDHGDEPKELILVGKALGASAGALCAMVMNDSGELKLDGRPMPQGLSGVLLSPWLAATPGMVNRLRKLASRVPLINRVAVGHDYQTTLRLDTPRALQTTLKAVEQAKQDLDKVIDRIARGRGPNGRLYIIHGARDRLVDPDKSVWLASSLGNRGILRLVDARYSDVQRDSFMRDYVMDGLNAIVTQGIRDGH